MEYKKHFSNIFFVLIFSLAFCISSYAQTYDGPDVYLYNQTVVNDFGANNYTTINASVAIMSSVSPAITDLSPLSTITSISGDLWIHGNTGLTNLQGLQNLTSVGGDLRITNNANLTSIAQLGNITSIGDDIQIEGNNSLINLTGLENITSVDELYISTNSALIGLHALGSLTSVNGTLTIGYNSALTNLDGLESLTYVGLNLYIWYNALTDLDGLKNLGTVDGTNIEISDNTSLGSFCGLYHLFSEGTYPIMTLISDNLVNPSVQDIKDAGPCTPDVTVISVDIQPGTCPNSLSVRNKGAIPVAILGTDDLDVQNIDPATLLLEGISPLRWSIKDVATPVSGGEECDCTSEGPDGFNDLNLKFDSQELIAALGEINDGDELVLTLTGDLLDGTPIEGSDCVVIRAKGLHKDLTGNLNDVPKEYALFGNYPNPFNPSTTIKFAVPEESFIKLEVYNTLGESVNTLVAETLTAGIYSVDWNAADLSSGIYIYRIQAGSFVETKKMILMK